MPDLSERLDELERLEKAATPGPWNIWDGPQYVGGGADLCIGAGDKWLANMDHRNCERRMHHLGCHDKECRLEHGETDVCSFTDQISAEQSANAALIAELRNACPDLIALARRALAGGGLTPEQRRLVESVARERRDAAKYQAKASWTEQCAAEANAVETLLRSHDSLTARVAELEGQLADLRAKLETIVCTQEPDAGVVLLSHDGPTHYEAGIGQVYDHQYFSPLGDALIEAWKLTALSREKEGGE